MDDDLAGRLREVGVEDDRIDDPADAWHRLFGRFGLQATLIDRYAIEAAHRGTAPEQLSDEDRQRLGEEVLAVRYPGIELVGSPSGALVRVVAYDQRWPEVFASWRLRLGDALGDVALAIEHIGSTAVPGIAAKPIVDIQIAVADLEAEATYVPAIDSLGVPLRSREPDHRYFRPAAGTPRVVHIHVCPAGGEWERSHLLYRDYLRAQPEVREAYAALKRSLADDYRRDRLAYTEAKTGFILDALEAAEEWAQRTGWATSS